MTIPRFDRSLGTVSLPLVQSILESRHGRLASGTSLLRIAPKLVASRLFGTSVSEALTPADMTHVAMAVPRETGELLYLTARTLRARNIVEFGTSFGTSTIYLAAAAKDNGGGLVIGTEIESSKAHIAQGRLQEAQLDAFVDIRVGDAMHTLRSIDASIDMVFLDGWKDLYLPVLRLLEPYLRPGAVVLADNLHTFPTDLAEYAAYVARPGSGYITSVLPLGEGVAYSVFTGFGNSSSDNSGISNAQEV